MVETMTALKQEKPNPAPRELIALPPQAGGPIAAFIPRSPEEISWLVGMVIGAGLAPDSYCNDRKKMAIGVLKGLEIGVAPLTALANIAIINGRPCIWGDLAMALVQNRGVLVRVLENEIGTKPVEGTETSAIADDYGYEVHLWRAGQEGAWIGRFTVGDAKRARLWMNPKRPPWMLYPRRMLLLRARAFALRDGFADCLAGMGLREEVEDIPRPPPAADTSYLDDLETGAAGSDSVPDAAAQAVVLPDREPGEEG